MVPSSRAGNKKRSKSGDEPVAAKQTWKSRKASEGEGEALTKRAAVTGASNESLRINQAIAKTGFCSRRNADELIAAGRVKLNGKVVKDFGVLVSDRDKLMVDNKPIAVKRYTYVAMYKPFGIVTTCQDEQERETILDLLPENLQHLRPVGRLDLASEGLMILTNDGDLTQKLTHPSMHTDKRYVVTVKGSMTPRDLKLMASGIELDDGITLPAKVRLLEHGKKIQSTTSFELVITEGRNRQIRRMCEKLGYSVIRLVRTGIGALQLGKMTPGTWRYLTVEEINAVNNQYGRSTSSNRSETKNR